MDEDQELQFSNIEVSDLEQNNNQKEEEEYIENAFEFDNLKELQYLIIQHEIQNVKTQQKQFEKKFAYDKTMFYFAKIKTFNVIKQHDQYKIIVKYYIKFEDNKKFFLDPKKYINTKHIKDQIQKNKEQQCNNEEQLKYDDGIYNISEFKNDELLIKAMNYLLRGLNREVTFSHFTLNLIYMLQALEKNQIPIDYTAESLLIIKQNEDIKFVFCPRFIKWSQTIYQLIEKSDLSFGNEYTEIKRKKIQQIQNEDLGQFMQDLMDAIIGKSNLKTNQDTQKDLNYDNEDELFIDEIKKKIKDNQNSMNPQIIMAISQFKKKDIIDLIKRNQLLYQFNQDDKVQFQQQFKQLFKREADILLIDQQEYYNQNNFNSLNQQQMQSETKAKVLEDFFVFFSNQRDNMKPQKQETICNSVSFRFTKLNSQSKKDQEFDLQLSGSIIEQIFINNKLQEQSQNQTSNKQNPQKNILIEYMEKKNCLMVRVMLDNLNLNIENSDEVIFSSQLIVSREKQILFDVDDKRRLNFRATVCIGQGSKVLQKVIEMIDICLIYAICYNEFYINNTLQNRSTNKIDKFSQLYSEMNFYVEDYIEENYKYFKEFEKIY